MPLLHVTLPNMQALLSLSLLDNTVESHATLFGVLTSCRHVSSLNVIRVRAPRSGSAAPIGSIITLSNLTRLCLDESVVFFMEAMWTRFQPLSLEVKKIIDEGRLGLPVLVHADLSGNFNIHSKIITCQCAT